MVGNKAPAYKAFYITWEENAVIDQLGKKYHMSRSDVVRELIDRFASKLNIELLKRVKK